MRNIAMPRTLREGGDTGDADTIEEGDDGENNPAGRRVSQIS